ncbi:ubiquitin-related domain-containing protein [Kockovaella imperatae]|uniref:Ubiquitin-related domain-containing protein n=1 Tax=Kockovaella imperatae TaxID=4999 RepID=A0A1Y1ULU4_9TREE|nr:ubiquitin-related domain-containing protein [Kockovaella imperatae]ORX38962.1 ubiquitin-related domain-containing protein [Kockovaella imperatae]
MSDSGGDQPSGGPRTLDGRPAEALPEGWGQPARKSGAGASSTARTGGIATLFNTGISGNRPTPAEDSDDEDDGRRRAEELFAGGERSGLAVTNPDQPGDRSNDVVKNILKQAKEGGVHETKAKERKPFTGSGNRLGSEDDPEPEQPEQPEPPQSGSSGMSGLLAGMFGRGAGGPPPPPDDDDDEEETQVRRLTFWSDGFSIEDGPLLPYDTPENKDLLAAIQAGRAPPSVFNVGWNQPLRVEVANRQNTPYQAPPKKPMQAFSGGGQRLGSPAPEVVSGATTPNVPGGLGSGATSNSSTQAPSFSLDSSKPTTSVQVRLADGTRLVAKVNLTHTVADLRSFVAAARPDARPFILQTTFPSKELSDHAQTVEEAKLQNAVVVQRFT